MYPRKLIRMCVIKCAWQFYSGINGGGNTTQSRYEKLKKEGEKGVVWKMQGIGWKMKAQSDEDVLGAKAIHIEKF